MQFEYLVEKWRGIINHLLPRGEAIPRQADSNWQKWVKAIATVFARVDDDIEATALEWNPLTTVTRLDDWEKTTIGPNDCGLMTGTQEERRARVKTKLRLVAGGMDGGNGSSAAIAYLESVAERAGYDVTITKVATCVLECEIHSFNGGVACVPRSYGEPYGGLYGDCGYALLACIFDKVSRASYEINFIWPEP